MTTCKTCHRNEALWAWQPTFPQDEPQRGLTFMPLGSHYRGYSVIKVCDACKTILQTQPAATAYFTVAGVGYRFQHGHITVDTGPMGSRTPLR